ncbi:MAG: MFS transporter [Polyangiaceae bacterium]|nr:MFS transporter [Polyangiaceae bacterium]
MTTGTAPATGPEPTARLSRAAFLAVLVAALGYFVDIYDLLLFSIVRTRSLKAIGVPPEQLLDQGVFLINMQMIGLLLGGIFWGVLGDKRGRLSVLFGSIVTYSLANIANAYVTTVPEYAFWRFVAGVGLAGELGAGITLVAETLGKRARGYGTTVVAGVGLSGAVVGALVANSVDWTTAYKIGGGLGLALLALRVGVFESGLYQKAKGRSDVALGNFFALFSSRARVQRYLAIIAVGVPIWFSIGILVSFSPEIGKALGMTPAPDAAKAVMWAYAGLAVGDLSSGALSQAVKSRKRSLLVFLLLTVLTVAVYFLVGPTSLVVFYAVCSALGFANGYWAVFVTVASEQFGTNLRATATTTVPNFVRGAVVPLSLSFKSLSTTGLGVSGAALVVGAVSLGLAFLGLYALEETYGKDLEYFET